jgi:hypothetical protein
MVSEEDKRVENESGQLTNVADLRVRRASDEADRYRNRLYAVF